MDFVNQYIDSSPPNGFIGPLMLGEDESPLRISKFGPRAALIEKNINWDDFLIVVETFKTKDFYTKTIEQFFDWYAQAPSNLDIKKLLLQYFNRMHGLENEKGEPLYAPTSINVRLAVFSKWCVDCNGTRKSWGLAERQSSSYFSCYKLVKKLR